MSDEITIDQDLDKPIYGTGEHYEPVPLTPEDDRIVEEVLQDILERTTVHEIRGAEVEIYHLAGTDQDHDQSTHAPNKDGGDSKGKFFSPLKRALDLAKQNKAPGRDWASILSKAQGVTKDELAATGILDWLKGKGTEQVTKAELQKFASDHAVEIRPVVLGGSHPNADALNRESSDLYAQWGELQRSREAGMPDKEWQEISAKMIAIEERRREIGNELNKTPAPKFEQYTLPGAENYREVLLTLPVKGDALPPGFTAIEKDGTWGVRFPDGTELMGWSSREAAIQSQAKQEGNPVFRSDHFDQSNIVAHLRMDDRVDVDGNKVLFIEEIQSDWAQEGRKEGFRGEFPQDIFKAAIAGGMSEEQAIADINHLLKEPLDTEDRRTVAQWSALTNAVEKGGMSSTRLNEVFHDRRDQGVPLAPFVTDTQAWVGLAMKHAMTEAVDGGYNAVAWTTGAQQNERYNLAKAVDELEYIPSINRLIGWKDRASAVSETVTPDKLGDYVGKELAQKLLATPLNSSGRHVLGGEGLKVGGEGMKAFYDSLVPSVAGKLIRKNDPEAKIEEIKTVFQRLMKLPTGEYIPISGSTDASPNNQPGFYITPKMREQLRRGISLFEAEELHSHKFEKREPNKYERRVDYAKIEKSLDGLIAEGGIAARKALVAAEKRHLDLIVARMDSKLSADDVAALRIDTGAVVLGTFDQLLHDAWRLGVEHTYHEHPGHAESLRARQFAGLEPEAAMRYFRARALDMKGIIDDDLTEATKQELLMFLKGARSIPESIDNIRRIFEPFVGDPTKIQPSGQIGIGFPPGEMGPENVLMAYRLENIIRTPTTEAYNQGRLAVGDEMEEFVVGYAYSALLDERTTEICQFLDQFMLRKDDPALRKLTPPNHFQCRSILVFITQEDLPVEFTDPETIDEGIRIVQAGFK